MTLVRYLLKFDYIFVFIFYFLFSFVVCIARKRVNMACNGCMNLEDRFRRCEEEITFLRSFLCANVVTLPQSQERPASSTAATAMSEWRSVGSLSPGQRLVKKLPTEQPLSLANRFTPLQDEVAEHQEILVVGDSMVRGYDNILQRKTKRRCKLVCQPGRGIAEGTLAIRDLKQMNTAVTVVHTGSNDVGKVRSEDLVRKYNFLLQELKKRGGQHVVCGVLPRFSADSWWNSRAIGVNERISKLCKQLGFLFLDPWCRFSRRRDLYAFDGVHLNRRGKEVFTDLLLDVCNKPASFLG